MKAMVYHGANDIRFEEKPRPQIIDPTDAVVKIVKTTICGTDLGIWKGKNPEVADGRILGHEGIGIVEEVGEAVKNIKVGDKVIISCVSKCCTCDNCKIQLYSHCRNGGWILGYKLASFCEAKNRAVCFQTAFFMPAPAGFFTWSI